MENKFKFFCRINTFALYKHTKKETDLKITFGPASHHCGACHDLQAGEWDGLLHRQVQLLYGGGGEAGQGGETHGDTTGRESGAACI